MARQAQHAEAEVATLLDTPRFIRRAEDIYGYPNFICDSGGSTGNVADNYTQLALSSRKSGTFIASRLKLSLISSPMYRVPMR